MNKLSIENKIQLKTIELKEGESYNINGNEIITVVQGEMALQKRNSTVNFMPGTWSTSAG